VAAGLLLVAAVRFGGRLDRLPVRNARRLEVDVDAEAPLQLRDGHLDVQLSLAVEQQFLGLRVAAVADRRILFFETVHRGADLVFVAAALGLDRIRQHRLRDLRALCRRGLAELLPYLGAASILTERLARRRQPPAGAAGPARSPRVHPSPARPDTTRRPGPATRTGVSVIRQQM